MILKSLVDLLWPVDWPILPNSKERVLDRLAEEKEIDDIRSTNWAANTALALKEAQRISQHEEERRRIAESKAFNFLLFSSGLIPLFIFVESIVWNKLPSIIPLWIKLLVLGLAIAYLFRAFIWAFGAIKIRPFHCIYTTDLCRIFGVGKLAERRLLIETLIAIRRNQSIINCKLTATAMSQRFFLRSIIALTLILLARLTVIII